MDSFHEPQQATRPIQLNAVRDAVRAREADLRAQGIHLSGRVLHVCHYLPITATLHSSSRPGIISPPATPPPAPADIPPSPVEASQPPATDAPQGDEPRLRPKWSLAARQGHAAMISGIRSLSATHDQLIIGWTGDIESPVSSSSGEKLTIPSNALSDEDKAALEHEIAHYEPDDDDSAKSRTSYVPVWLEDGVAHGHYEGYCKNTLWPLFHYLLWQDVAPNSNSASFSADAHWPPYEAANAAFARRVAEIYQPGDLVWVHDYHLLLVPRMIRGLGQGICIGLFVHTPWPSSEVFRCLPRRKEILDGMLGANLVCFQTYSYARHFVSSCVRVCGYEVAPTGKGGKGSDTGESMGIDVQGHVTAVRHCSVGVDAERVAKDLLRPGIQPNLAALLKLYTGKKIIIGRDKLDVVKGVLQKLRAFAKLLRDYPEWRGKVVLIQVTSPALSDSPRLERQVSELVSSINGEFGGLDFVPVHHYHQTIKKDEFYALLSAADLGVITPLRDGMNTTSMEFVIAQDKTKHSPLVLSEFMGISSNMIEALQINPWNLGDVAAAMDRGLRMSDEEKLTRHKALYQVATTHTSHTWAAMLVKMLLNAMDSQNMARQTPVLPLERMVERYAAAKKRLFLCDYDGTLAPIVKTPSMAVPSPETLQALETLSTNPQNLVYIISGRDGAFLEAHLGHLTHLGMSAEHGGFIREPGARTWTNFTATLDMGWMDEVLEVFRYYTERTTGSHIEVKKSSITWHYRSSDPEWGQFQCRQCQDLLENNVAHKRPIEVLVGKKNLEVRPIAVNKGEIVKRILYEHPDAEFVFCAGDDKTDEDMFRSLCFQSPGADGALHMDPPLSMTLAKDKDKDKDAPAPAPEPKTLALRADDIFTTAVGHATKRTLAKWHVTSPAEVIGGLLTLAGEERHERELEREEGEAKL
ncbi:glycosyltransferase family 20 protein [Dentipellis sp. KUC8613]|nr:glycosyltransferase family 20 protein [Dentipellis sp. KUC8613]